MLSAPAASVPARADRASSSRVTATHLCRIDLLERLEHLEDARLDVLLVQCAARGEPELLECLERRLGSDGWAGDERRQRRRALDSPGSSGLGESRARNAGDERSAHVGVFVRLEERVRPILCLRKEGRSSRTSAACLDQLSASSRVRI